jgi:hypothetical protein
MSDSGWFEVTSIGSERAPTSRPSDTFPAHTLTVRPDGNLKIEWEGGGHSFTAGSYIALSLSASCP